jgi:hypothetical protein
MSKPIRGQPTSIQRTHFMKFPPLQTIEDSGWLIVQRPQLGQKMKNTSKLIAAALLTLGFAASGFAKEVTLTGEGKCAKCALKKSDTCQNVVEVKKGDKTTLYYLTGDASKGFHKNLCSGSAKVKVSGKASEKDGKNELEVTKIEKAD